jgi:hypothetical protein
MGISSVFFETRKTKKTKGNNAQKVPMRTSRKIFVVNGNILIPKSLARNKAPINTTPSMVKVKIKSLYRE